MSVGNAGAANDNNGEASIEIRPHTLGKAVADPSKVPVLPHNPLHIKPIGRLEYYEEPRAFSLVDTVKQNKMILFMLVGILFAVGMPKLLVSRENKTICGLTLVPLTLQLLSVMFFAS